MKKHFASFFNSGPALIVSAAVLWALDGVIRRSLFTLPAVTIVFYEHLIGSLILMLVAFHTISRIRLTKKVVGLTVVVALLSGLLGTLWFTTALLNSNFIPFSVVFLLQKLQPIFAVSAAAVILKEKVNKAYVKWAGLALVAAYFVTFPGGVVNFSTGNGTVIAALFALGAAFAWGTGTVFSKLLLQEVTNTQATSLRFFATTLFSFVAVFLFGQQVSLSTIEPSQVLRLIFIALSTGMVALWLYYKGLKKTQAKISTILELTFPLLAVFIDAVLYQTWLAPSQYLAAIVLFFALYKTSKL